MSEHRRRARTHAERELEGKLLQKEDVFPLVSLKGFEVFARSHPTFSPKGFLTGIGRREGFPVLIFPTGFFANWFFVYRDSWMLETRSLGGEYCHACAIGYE
jgi:hypothetical protein